MCGSITGAIGFVVGRQLTLRNAVVRKQDFFGMSDHVSRTTWRGDLSNRTPSRRGWRSLPCTVHSIKPTCTTISGRTQWARSRGSPLAIGEWRVRDFDGIESSAEIEQELGVEARAHFAGEHEILTLEIPDEQRSEANACALRIGEAADDQLLGRFAFHLEPMRRAAVFVRRIAPFGDDTLPALAARLFPRLGVVKRGHARERRTHRNCGQQCSARIERERRDVTTAKPGHVEHVIRDRAGAPDQPLHRESVHPLAAARSPLR